MHIQHLVSNLIVIPAALGAAVYITRAGWFWQSSTEILTADELAGLSDGRNVIDEVIDASMRQSAMIAKGARAASIAAILAACALAVHWL